MGGGCARSEESATPSPAWAEAPVGVTSDRREGGVASCPWAGRANRNSNRPICLHMDFLLPSGGDHGLIDSHDQVPAQHGAGGLTANLEDHPILVAPVVADRQHGWAQGRS